MAAITLSTREPLGSNRYRLLAAIPLTLGILLSVLGLAWDIQWHDDVGPDTFFTLPHLVLYSGVALAGLVCLIVVLQSTLSYQRGHSIFPENELMTIWPVFRAPASFVLGGVGSASFLLFGLYDEIWHRTFGFDVTLVSPPHQGLLFSILLSMVGCIAVFASIRTKSLAKVIGLSAAMTIILAIFPAFLQLTHLIPYQNIFELSIATVFTMALFIASSATQQIGTATLVALFITVLRTATWFLTPWLTEVYAGSQGLLIREHTNQFPGFAGQLPLYFLGAALLVDALLLFSKRRNFSTKLSVLLAGATSCVLLVLPFNFAYLGDWYTFLPLTLLLAVVLGTLASWFGWKLGTVLRHVAR
jgi:hypothetical protein